MAEDVGISERSYFTTPQENLCMWPFLCKIHSKYSHGWTDRGPTDELHRPIEQVEMDKTLIQLISTSD